MSEEFLNRSAHGRQAITFVCMHIVETLRDEVPRGFHFLLDEDDNYQSFCSERSAMSDERWARTAVDVGRLLCFGCFQRAAEINGVVVAERSA